MNDMPRRLPVIMTVRRAHISLRIDPRAAVRCAWPWVLLTSLVVFAVAWGIWPLTSAVAAKVAAAGEGDAALTVTERLIQVLDFSIGELIEIPALASIAVAWHRRLLLGEKPGGARLRLDRPVVAYMGFSALLTVVQLLFFAVPQHASLSMPALSATTAIAGFVVIGFVMPRLGLYLPALALQRSDVSLMDVWRRTRGNTWRLAWGTLLALLPSIVVILGIFCAMSAITGLDTFESNPAAYAMFSVAMFWATAVTAFIVIAFLSYSYRHFFGVPDPSHG